MKLIIEDILKNEKGVNFDDCVKSVEVKGCILEFGVAEGRSLKHLADLQPERNVYGFDSFEGLPEDWTGRGIGKGTFACNVPNFEQKNISIIKGLFADTLPNFMKYLEEPIALIHIDCDLYSSTKTVFENISRRVQVGTIILFDEFTAPNDDPNVWSQHEFKAFAEYLEKYDIDAEIIGSYGGEQMAFRITRINEIKGGKMTNEVHEEVHEVKPVEVFKEADFHIKGKLKFEGHEYDFGSGITTDSPHIPFGDYLITPGEVGSWGKAHGAIGVNHNKIWDSRLNRFRLGIEIHCGHLPYLYSHGCIAIHPNQWTAFKAHLLAFITEKKHAFLHVHTTGASIDDFTSEVEPKVEHPVPDPATVKLDVPASEKGVLLYLPGMWSRYYSIKPEVVEGYVKEYAKLKGYDFDHINISGDYRTNQYNAALKRISKGDVTALYGFSAGGYNVNHLLPNLSKALRDKIQLEVVVGSPGVNAYPGIKEHVIQLDPPEGHLHGPEVLLKKLKDELAKEEKK